MAKSKRKGKKPNNQASKSKKYTGMEALPDEILLVIVRNLETTRDIMALARTSKKINRCVSSSSAWSDFVRAKFEFTTIPQNIGKQGWKGIASSLTYQARCWDRRSIRFTALFPAHKVEWTRGVPRRVTGLEFPAVVDVQSDIESRSEIVVWGAGEDVVARYRQKSRNQAQKVSVSWRQLNGAQHGLVGGGGDDVRTIKLVDLPHLKGPAMLLGRHNGDLSLLSAENNNTFGRPLANFSPSHTASGTIQGVEAGTEKELKQQLLTSVDVLNDQNEGLVAACTNLGVSIYRLPESNETTSMPPVALYNLSQRYNSQVVWDAKWMGSKDLLALAIRGKQDPLRCLSITPTGWKVEAAAKNAGVAHHFRLEDSSILANSLQPVRRYPCMTGPNPLLLSSWTDNTVRLQDLRTPCPFDTVYQNNINPSGFGSLLTYGAYRFIGGGMSGATVQIFDFRWPKMYYHTTAMDCSNRPPFPRVEQRFTKPPADKSRGRSCCDHLRGFRCRWHELSRDIYYRPNAIFMLSNSLPDHLRQTARVHSLAKASDVSPNFYVGISGGVIEANLGTISGNDFDQILGFPDYDAAGRPQSERGGYASRILPATMMEVGDGLREPRDENNVPLPTVHSRQREQDALLKTVDPSLRKRNRLDQSFQSMEDFQQEREGSEWLSEKLALE